MTRDFEKNNNDHDFVDLPDEKESTQLDRLDDLLSSLAPDTTILIERVQPTWCSGILEEVTLTETIGIEYFIEQWGGHLLSVKIRGTRGRFNGRYKIPLFSYPPLRYGELISPHNKRERFKEDDSQIVQNPSPSQVVVNPANPFEKLFSSLPAVLPLVLDYMRNQETKRQNDLAMMMQMMKSNSGGGLSDITKVGAVMGQLNEMFKQNAGISDQGSGEMDFIPHAIEVLKLAMGNQQQQQQPKTFVPKKAPPPPTQRPSLPPENVTPLKRDLSTEISKMPPNEAAQIVIDALGRMPSDKRDAAMGSFLSQFQSDMEGEDGFDEEIYDDDEIDKTGV